MAVPTNPKQLWVQIQNQLPEYIKSDPAYSQLISFLNLYYQWLQTTSQPVQVIADQATNESIDDTVDQFVKYFTDTYLDNFPLIYDITDDPTTKALKHAQIVRLIKHADELYISKGTDDSIRMLFRVLFGEEVNLFFPKTVLFKPSDGHWTLPITIKINVLSGDITSLDLTYGSVSVEESVDGTTNTLTGASATIEAITAVHDYYELYVSRGTLTTITKAYSANSGNLYAFTPGNKVIITSGSTSIIGSIYPVPSLFTLTDKIGGHVAGQPLYVGTSGGSIDNNIILNVKSVDTNGNILKVNVVDSFNDITIPINTLFDLSLKPVGSVTIGGLTYYPGFWQTVNGVNLGFLSDQIKLRGPIPIKSLPNGISPQEYYQEFSYVIQTAVSPKTWLPTVKSLLHPVGYQVFGDIQISTVNQETNNANVLGLYRYNQDSVNDLDSYMGYKYHILNVLGSGTEDYVLIISQGTNILGPSMNSLNKWMMMYPPYVGGDVNYEGGSIPASSAAFSGSLDVPAWTPSALGATTIKDFSTYAIGNFIGGLAPTIRAPIAPMAFVIIE